MVDQMPHDLTQRDLSRLLSRLDAKLFTSSNSELRALHKSTYERNKVNANIEYARALLFRLEHDNPSAKGAPTSARQHEHQADLQEIRVQVKRLQKRLDDIAHTEEQEYDSEEDTESSEDEDLASFYAPAIQDTHGGLDVTVAETPAISTTDAQKAAAAATLTSTLRSRKGAGHALSPDSAARSGSRNAASSSTLGNITPFSPAPSSIPSANNDASTAQLLESHDSEQNAITDSLLTLASALKQSTLSFADSLDSSNPLVDAAASALDKNVTGMEAAGKRMSSLRRMNEGWGWWRNISLYVRVAILWAVAILVGLVLPKLRF